MVRKFRLLADSVEQVRQQSSWIERVSPKSPCSRSVWTLIAIVDASHESARRRNLKNRMDGFFKVTGETPPLLRAAFTWRWLSRTVVEAKVQSMAISIASPFTMRASSISACTVVAARRRSSPSLICD